MIVAQTYEHPGNMYGSDGTLIGRKDMSDTTFLAPLLERRYDDARDETVCPHGAYRFGPGLSMYCNVCGEGMPT